MNKMGYLDTFCFVTIQFKYFLFPIIESVTMQKNPFLIQFIITFFITFLVEI